MVPAFEAETNRGGEIDGATREAFISLWKHFYIKASAYLKSDGKQLAPKLKICCYSRNIFINLLIF